MFLPLRPLIATALALALSTPAPAAEPRSYLRLPDGGRVAAPPHAWEWRSGNKHLLVLGTRHLTDPRAAMFDRIEAAFGRVAPQLVLHESTVPEGLGRLPRGKAIAVGADLGFTAWLAQRDGIALRSADAPPAEEMEALLAHHPAREVFVFLTAQRLIGSQHNPDLANARAQYPGFHADYLRANGLPARPGWAAWDGFAQAWRDVTGTPLSAPAWNPDDFSPVNPKARFGALARTSNGVRDRRLLAAIREALGEYDRVVVVFGTWHVLAIEPVLEAEFGSRRPTAAVGLTPRPARP